MKLEGMPAAAQHLPKFEELGRDAGLDLDVRQCMGCGLVQLDCEPVAYFREVIRAVAFSDEMRAFRVTQLSAFAKQFSLNDKSVLEIGCGRGEYLKLLNDSGMKAWGTEAGVDSVRHATEDGLRVQQVFPDADNTFIDGAPFDGFFSFNFMEHWPQPRKVLDCIKRHLNTGAVGLVEVPNFDMLVQQGMAVEFVSDHLSYFTAASLRTALELSGFEVLEVREIWYRYILSATVRKRIPLDGNCFIENTLAQRKRVLNFIESSAQKDVAIWGAGHQALASIALLELSDKVRYVIDSAPFKQGRFTPATHLPIVSPDELDRNPVGAILIMAAGFSDEVAETIRNRWGSSFKLAIARESSVEVL
jgi:SAM-dependent methyltransferase